MGEREYWLEELSEKVHLLLIQKHCLCDDCKSPKKKAQSVQASQWT